MPQISNFPIRVQQSSFFTKPIQSPAQLFNPIQIQRKISPSLQPRRKGTDATLTSLNVDGQIEHPAIRIENIVSGTTSKNVTSAREWMETKKLSDSEMLRLLIPNEQLPLENPDEDGDEHVTSEIPLITSPQSTPAPHVPQTTSEPPPALSRLQSLNIFVPSIPDQMPRMNRFFFPNNQFETEESSGVVEVDSKENVTAPNDISSLTFPPHSTEISVSPTSAVSEEQNLKNDSTARSKLHGKIGLNEESLKSRQIDLEILQKIANSPKLNSPTSRLNIEAFQTIDEISDIEIPNTINSDSLTNELGERERTQGTSIEDLLDFVNVNTDDPEVFQLDNSLFPSGFLSNVDGFLPTPNPSIRENSISLNGNRENGGEVAKENGERGNPNVGAVFSSVFNNLNSSFDPANPEVNVFDPNPADVAQITIGARCVTSDARGTQGKPFIATTTHEKKYILCLKLTD